ncbi:hypothetical protein CANCADRAFT_107218 [Tortispora caseinolytica NRRL Y-17796]|uniref:Coenzyme Q-binding protein COQ10 START domain-containing protein n=1 Tax=Tortispora caseinolytica NRRL Y-17796 TaxID=767744 RepID=A0A1E4TFI6_9ASCO|nr:hypothetical protein CANCADRAFT_107218 [Tortispora caseinolytica NRRL Y-17796]
MYAIISNVDSYSEFIPYCVESTVTAKDTKTGQPAAATLRVGWKNFDESFESKLTCVTPHTVIAEALNNSVFDTLYSEWTLKPIPAKPNLTKVHLNLVFKFNNPIYNTVSNVFAPTVTELMIRAFTDRAKQLASASM